MQFSLASVALIVAVSRLAASQQCVARGEVQLDGDLCKPDLSTWVTNEDGSQDWLEAYKINSTDRTGNVSNAGNANSNANANASSCANASECFSWVSIGVPQLIPTVVHTSYDQRMPLSITTFLFSRTDFSFALRLLSASQQLALASQATKKYGQSVLTSRIFELPVSQLSCNLQLIENSGNSHVLYGHVLSFTKRPLTVHFQAPVGSKERRLAEQHLQAWNSPQLLEKVQQNEAQEVSCRAVYGAQTEQVKRLTVSGEAYETLVTQLLESQSTQDTQVLLTWTQFQQFASRVHELFSVGEQYRLSVNEFSYVFFDELMQSSAVSTMEFHNASEALSKLSTFGRTHCVVSQNESDYADVGKLGCSAAEMLTDLNSLFKSQLRNQTAKVNQEHVEELRDFGRLVDTTYLNVIELGSQFHKTTDGTRLSLADLLRNLNTQKDAEVAWQLTRNRNIFVKSVKAATLNRTLFNKTFTFKSVRKTDYITLFSRDFKLTFTKDGIVQQALGEAGYLNDLYAARFNQAVQVLAENLTHTANVIESRYASMSREYDQKVLTRLANLESENVRIDLGSVKRCIRGFDLEKYDNLSLIECRDRFKEYSGAVGFNFYASNVTGASLCELKKPITGHTFLAQSEALENCTFYYQRCKASEAKIYANKSYFTEFQVTETLTEAQSRCSRLRQHVLELRDSNEVSAFAGMGLPSNYHLNSMVSSDGNRYVWLSDTQPAYFNNIGFLNSVHALSGYCLYANVQSIYNQRFALHLNQRPCSTGEYTVCQCNEYAAF